MEKKEPKEPDLSIGSLLEKTWSLTNPTNDEKEPYILTPEEELKVFIHHVNMAKENFMVKWQEKGFSHMEVLSKMAAVDWNKEIEANKKKILSIANSNKHQDLWHAEQRLNESRMAVAEAERLKAEWSAATIFRLMKWTSRNKFKKELVVFDHQKHLIKAICYFLSRDPKFETELGYSFDKGLLVRGPTGVGKTHLIRCAEENLLNPILLLSMIEITEEIYREGSCKIELSGRKVIYIDDVGTEEPTVNVFGTKISWFKNFIESRYLRGLMNNLIISTNLNFKEMELSYGLRVRSRVGEMFNIIDVSGLDIRANGMPEQKKGNRLTN